MKITSIDIIRAATGGRASDGTRWSPTFIKINTDEGILGYGEIGLAYSDAIDAAAGILTDFCSIIIGMDPLQNEKIWNTLLRNTFWGQGGGVVFGGISAIDIALWDIKGKYYNAPVFQLLGGKTNDKLRAYASQVQFDWGPVSKNLVTPEEYAQTTLKAKKDGYDCIKVDPLGVTMDGGWRCNFCGMLSHQDIKMAVDRVAACREAGGDDMDIIIELHSQTDVNSAIPLASGERIYSRWGYRPFFEDRSLSVIQPDLGNCGGLTEGKKIADMANVYDIGVQLHICGGPIATAAALQLEAVIPNFIIHEQHQYALMEENIQMCKYNYQPVNGYFTVPNVLGRK